MSIPAFELPEEALALLDRGAAEGCLEYDGRLTRLDALAQPVPVVCTRRHRATITVGTCTLDPQGSLLTA